MLLLQMTDVMMCDMRQIIPNMHARVMAIFRVTSHGGKILAMDNAMLARVDLRVIVE